MATKRNGNYVPKTYRFLSPAAILVFLFIVFIALLQSIPILTEYKSAKEFRDRQQSKVNRFESEQEDLKRQKAYFESGEIQDEAAIRERYRMVKPGEVLIQLEVDDKYRD